MGTILSNPSNVPVSVAADWETLLNVNAAGNAGKNMVTMTNWDSGTLAPSVAAGSIIEIAGSLAYFDVDQLPSGIATGVNYLKFTVSGTTVTPVWTLTAPTWNAAKGGWYSGSDRYSGHRVTLEGSSYYYKNKIKDGPGGIGSIPDYADPQGRYGSKTAQSGGETWIPPDGGYLFSSSWRCIVRIWNGSSWVPSSLGEGEGELGGGLYIFHDSNVAIYMLAGIVIHYRRLW